MRHNSKAWTYRERRELLAPAFAGSARARGGFLGAKAQAARDRKDSVIATKFFFVTGTSKGFGRVWASSAAIASSRRRDVDSLKALADPYSDAVLTLPLNVDDRALVFDAALEGFSQSLAVEVADFGINVTLVEPGPYATDWSTDSAVRSQPLAAYDGVRAKRAELRKTRAFLGISFSESSNAFRESAEGVREGITWLLVDDSVCRYPESED